MACPTWTVKAAYAGHHEILRGVPLYRASGVGSVLDGLALRVSEWERNVWV